MIFYKAAPLVLAAFLWQTPLLAQESALTAPTIDGPKVAIEKAVRPPTAKQAAARALLRTCSAEWRMKKAAGKTSGQSLNENWRSFLKACRTAHAAGGAS